MWELIGRPSVGHAVEVWWSGGRSACRKLEEAQMKVDRTLLGQVISTVQGELGWRKLEERRKDMKALFCKRLEAMEESQLVKMVVEKLREDGGIGWWEEYEGMRRKFELDNKVGLVGKLNNKIKARN